MKAFLMMFFLGLVATAQATDPCFNVFKDQASCDADAACAWCKCSAVPSNCFTIEQAKKLPSGVYTCDKGGDRMIKLSGLCLRPRTQS
ncbi:hypothetical protein CYMTET_3928 [Cymbomonas tetramitiformis]|uniref:Uncharacterized protein n=1 Tax=Cymbomonas tetramitiformis TaxID=36881 RepID=A0AAE0H254_9CHLO|nr:hypothetical protein CYMTET_3928 [Cymbomonas tetramitiformis]